MHGRKINKKNRDNLPRPPMNDIIALVLNNYPIQDLFVVMTIRSALQVIYNAFSTFTQPMPS
jgi:hypothetical protein